MAKTYWEKLKDPRWQKKRLEVLQRAEFRCDFCDSAEKTLHVHHKIYRKGFDPWDYADHELVALCEDCHEEETHVRKELAEVMALMPIYDLDRLLGYAQGMMMFCYQPAYLKVRLRNAEHASGVSDSIAPYQAEQLIDLRDHENCITSEALSALHEKRRVEKDSGILTT